MLNIERPRAHQNSITFFFIHPVYYTTDTANSLKKLFLAANTNETATGSKSSESNIPETSTSGIHSHYSQQIRQSTCTGETKCT